MAQWGRNRYTTRTVGDDRSTFRLTRWLSPRSYIILNKSTVSCQLSHIRNRATWWENMTLLSVAAGERVTLRSDDQYEVWQAAVCVSVCVFMKQILFYCVPSHPLPVRQQDWLSSVTHTQQHPASKKQNKTKQKKRKCVNIRLNKIFCHGFLNKRWDPVCKCVVWVKLLDSGPLCEVGAFRESRGTPLWWCAHQKTDWRLQNTENLHVCVQQAQFQRARHAAAAGEPTLREFTLLYSFHQCWRDTERPSTWKHFWV